MTRKVKPNLHDVPIRSHTNIAIFDAHYARQKWPERKISLFRKCDKDPNEPFSREYNHRQKFEQSLAMRHSPARFCEMIHQLDIHDDDQVHHFQRQISTRIGPLRVPPMVPFPLFKYGSAYFYLVPSDETHHPEERTPREGSWERKESPSPCDWDYTKYDPPITVPPHLRTSNDTEYTSSLRYAIQIGDIRCGKDDKPDKDYELEEAPFVVFLHPADKSFWIVYNTFGVVQGDVQKDFLALNSVTGNNYHIYRGQFGAHYRSFWNEIGESQNTVAVWRMPFSDVQRVAMSRSLPALSAEHITKGEPQGQASNAVPADVFRPQVIVEGCNPAWDSFNPKYPRPVPCWGSRTEIQEYLDDLVKSGYLNSRTAGLGEGADQLSQ